ncbi:MAG: macro domain-containing protein [Egibacteraceae bacterium]
MSDFREISSTERAGATVLAGVGDLTAQQVDAVVNAANEYLRHGDGVAGALASAGGPEIQNESDDWVSRHGPVGPGKAAVTTAGELPAEHLIHVVGPRYAEGQDNVAMLTRAVEAALGAAVEQQARSIALPAISAGIFGYPLDEAAAVIAETALRWLDEHDGQPSEIRLVALDEEGAQAFAAGF